MALTLSFPARSRAQLTATGLTINRGGRIVLNGVDMAVSPGSRWGIVGENGRGKSTLLHILAGSLGPDEGLVHRLGTLGSVEQEMSTVGERTVGDAIDTELAEARSALAALDRSAQELAEQREGAEDEYAEALAAAEALDAWDADRRVDVALKELGASTDRSRRLTDMSVGERYRVRLACILGAGHDFLLLDEPTNHLDAAGLDFLTGQLGSFPGGVVLVSHDRALLHDVATTILDLDPSRDGKARTYGGGYAGYVEGRAAERERWEDEYARQQAEHTKLSQDLSAAQNRLVAAWRPEKGHGKHQRATRAPALVRSVHRRQEDLEAHAVTVPEPPLQFSMPELSPRSGVPLLKADGVSLTGRLHEPFSLGLEHGSKLVVSGPNGAGKSTLMGLLAGLVEPSVGTIRRAPRTRIELLQQESSLPVSRRVRNLYEEHNASLASRGLVAESRLVPLSSLGLLSKADAGKRVGELSMGQRRRLDLALALASRPHVFLLDEPTNHLSIALVDELTEALEATAAAVVLATHDRQLRRDIGHWPHLPLHG